jgi:hypothetical protein
MATVSLEEAFKQAAADEFWAIRGKAIQAYATLEQSLSRIFAYLSGMDVETAGIIFFRIASADSRNKILEGLFKKKFKHEFNLFRNSLFDQLRRIDQERNQIVHWNAVSHIGANESGETISELKLMHPNFWPISPDSPTIDTKALLEFIAKCSFYSRLCNMFHLTTGGFTVAPPADFESKPWFDIFSQPITYPPPADHPLSQRPPEPDTPPPPSPA